MKKILFLAAALLCMAGCNEKPLDKEGEEPVKDEISVNPTSRSFGKEGGNAEVTVTSSGNWSMTSDSEYDWVTPSAKSGKNGAVVKFTVKENTTAEALKAVYTFKSGEATATFTINLSAGEKPDVPDEPYLTIQKTDYQVNENGGDIEVSVSTNIEYTVTPGANWVTVKSSKDNVTVLTVATLPAGTDSRETSVMFVKKDATTPGALVKIKQVRDQGGDDETLITTAGKFSSTRAYPKWDGKATAFENLSEFTFEALVYHEGGWKSLNTILGIDGYFMIRCGDDGIQRNEIQVATSADDSTDETKLNSGVLLDENKWYHIAVTFNKGTIKLYVDGEEKGTLVATNTSKRSFNREHTDEPGGWGATRCFWVGYSCGVSRCWSGMMSEIRVWNKALTASDLKAKNHFYKVDAKASGLIAYWKFNEGEGNVVKDQTSNGNNLYCQTNVKNDPPTTATAEDGMEWATVSLPE